MRRLAFIAAILFACFDAGAQPIPPTLDKGHRLLIENGLQVQGIVANYDAFHLSTYRNANYTAVHWLWDSINDPSAWANDYKWAIWARRHPDGDPSGPPEYPPRNPQEQANMGSLIAVQLGDEENLNDPALMDAYESWFAQARTMYPNQILFTNSYGGQWSDATMGQLVTRVKPDMISFDTYPFRVGEAPVGGSPTNWYADLRRHRQYALGAGVPLHVYRQTFHDSTIRDASPSEQNLNTFAPLAFGATYLTDFAYNLGASSMFNAPGGDSNPNAFYDRQKTINQRAQNLGKALVRLKPIPDAASDHTTNIVFILGRHATGPGTNAFNEMPGYTGFQYDAGSSNSLTDWEFGRNDPYLSGWAVTNITGTKNSGLKGDVILSWFDLLDESFDGPDWNNQRYLMVSNGLTAADGTAADCRQQIILDFGTTNPANPVAYPWSYIQRLNPDSGELENLNMSSVSGKRRLTLLLDGGMSELLKFPTGAPFVGVPEPASAAALLMVAGLMMQRRARHRELRDRL